MLRLKCLILLASALHITMTKRLTVGLDYSLQQWSKTKFGVNTSDDAVREDFDETYTYCDRHKISVGAEYIPNLIGRSYLSHIKYRLGAYYTTPYYKIGGKRRSPRIWRNCRFRSACASFPFHP